MMQAFAIQAGDEIQIVKGYTIAVTHTISGKEHIELYGHHSKTFDLVRKFILNTHEIEVTNWHAKGNSTHGL